MKSIYIILTQSGTGFSKLLKFISKEKYNHASICLDDSFNEFYSFGRKYVKFLLPGGFIIENAFKHVFGKYKEIPCLILGKKISDEQYDNLKSKIKEFIVNRDTYSYAILTLLFVDTPYSVIKNNKFFCSQFVAKILNDVSIETPKKPEHMHPIDFLQLNDVETLYEGELKKFCQNNKMQNQEVKNY